MFCKLLMMQFFFIKVSHILPSAWSCLRELLRFTFGTLQKTLHQSLYIRIKTKNIQLPKSPTLYLLGKIPGSYLITILWESCRNQTRSFYCGGILEQWNRVLNTNRVFVPARTPYRGWRNRFLGIDSWAP